MIQIMKGSSGPAYFLEISNTQSSPYPMYRI